MSVAATSSISEIPIEVLEKILDCLHDDPAALRSASLVSRNWVSAQRYHMFHQTVLRDVNLIKGIYPEPVVQENAQSFLSLVQSAHCTILPAIHCVILCINSATSLTEVVRVLAGAKALSKMVFFQTIPGPEVNPTRPMVADMDNIEDFTFNAWYALDDDDWRLITSFPRLRALAIHVGDRTRMSFPRDISGTAFSNIVNFQLRTTRSEELFQWMNTLDGAPLTRVETLDLRMFRSIHMGWGPITALNAFLRRNSETLTNLSVAVDYGGHGTPPSEEHLKLGPLTQLRSLFLQIHDVDAVCHSISSLNSRFVESLAVRTHIWPEDRYHLPRRLVCLCDFYALFLKLAHIMETKELFTETTMRNIVVPKQPPFAWNRFAMVRGSVSIRWTEKGELIPLSQHEYDKQRNTETSLASLIWKIPDAYVTLGRQSNW